MTRISAGLLAGLVAAAALSWGQDTRGTILGRVTDASGSPVPNAEVKLTNTATGVVLTAKTNDSGNYSMPYLTPGFYTVSSEMTGFKKFVRDGVQVRVNDSVELNISMTVGDVSESIEVTAETPLLSTADIYAIGEGIGNPVDIEFVIENATAIGGELGRRVIEGRLAQAHIRPVNGAGGE